MIYYKQLQINFIKSIYK